MSARGCYGAGLRIPKLCAAQMPVRTPPAQESHACGDCATVHRSALCIGVESRHCQVVGLRCDARRACTVLAYLTHRTPRYHTEIAIEFGTPVISNHESRTTTSAICRNSRCLGEFLPDDGAVPDVVAGRILSAALVTPEACRQAIPGIAPVPPRQSAHGIDAPLSRDRCTHSTALQRSDCR